MNTYFELLKFGLWLSKLYFRKLFLDWKYDDIQNEFSSLPAAEAVVASFILDLAMSFVRQTAVVDERWIAPMNEIASNVDDE